MARDLGLTVVQLGWLFSAFAWSYAFGQIPAGWICDRIGAKRSMLWGLAVWSLITVAMAATGMLPWPFWTMAVLRFALGLFETPVGPASGRIIAAWFPAAERGVAGSCSTARNIWR